MPGAQAGAVRGGLPGLLLALCSACATRAPASEARNLWTSEGLVCPTRKAAESLTCTRQTSGVVLEHTYGNLKDFRGPGVALLRSTSMPCSEIAVACTGRALAGELRQHADECWVLIDMPEWEPVASYHASVCKISDRSGASDTWFFHLSYTSRVPGERREGQFFPLQIEVDGGAGVPR